MWLNSLAAARVCVCLYVCYFVLFSFVCFLPDDQQPNVIVITYRRLCIFCLVVWKMKPACKNLFTSSFGPLIILFTIVNDIYCMSRNRDYTSVLFLQPVLTNHELGFGYDPNYMTASIKKRSVLKFSEHGDLLLKYKNIVVNNLFFCLQRQKCMCRTCICKN